MSGRIRLNPEQPEDLAMTVILLLLLASHFVCACIGWLMNPCG